MSAAQRDYRLIVDWADLDDDEGTEFAAIVHALAERGPIIYDGMYCETCPDTWAAGFLGMGSSLAEGWSDPANHDPSCLWRRARVLYPKGPA